MIELSDEALVASGVALAIAGSGALWLGSSLRSQLYGRWAPRVDLARSGLSEKAAEELFKIQRMTTDRVGSPSTPFAPLTVIADPFDLLPSMEGFIRLVKRRERLAKWFRRLCSVGDLMLLSASAFTLGTVATLLYLIDLYSVAWLGHVMAGVLSVGLVGMALSLGLYAYLEHRLTTSEFLASEDSP